MRLLQLDVLRGVAILLVLGAHAPSVGPGWSGRLRPIDAFIHRSGGTGVDLFFVLSGFLIGGLLVGEIKNRGRLDVRRFLVRRALRIWPPYYALLAVIIVRATMEPGGTLRAAWSRTWMAFVHIQNFIEAPRTQLWSLAVEEQFYLLLPIFLWLLTRRRGASALTAIPSTCAVLAVGLLLERWVLLPYTKFDRRLPMDALFFGVYLAYLRSHRPDAWRALNRYRTPLLAIAAALLVLWAFLSTRLQLTLGLTAVYLAYGIVLACFVQMEPGRWMDGWFVRAVAFIGTYSYSIYLWHRDTSWEAFETGLWAGNRLGLPHELTWILFTATYVGASMAGGVVMGWLIEAPVQKLREAMFPPLAPASGSQIIVESPAAAPANVASEPPPVAATTLRRLR